jgi:hypothetical protein
MPKVTFNLEEQFSDLRSKDRVYRLKIDNQGATAVNLLSVTPRIPENVELVEVKSPSVSAIKAKHSELCAQLTEILSEYLRVHVKEFRDQRTKIFIEDMRQFLTLKSILWFYLPFLKSFGKSFERARLRREAFGVTISNHNDAQSALTRFFCSAPDDDTIKKIFVAKAEQVSSLEAQQGGQSEVLATIEPDSFYAASYTLRFPRSVADPKKYNLAIEGTYSEAGRNERHVGGAVESLIISPRPEVLTFIAVMSSILGVILRFTTGFAPASQAADFHGLIWPAIDAAIVSLVFFNIYEFTSLGEKFKMTVGWRSALIVGLLCGLLEKNVLDALKTFVGR